MKRFWTYFQSNWSIVITIMVFVALTSLWLFNPWDILSWFFGEYNTKSNADVLSYIGVVCGAVIVVSTLFVNNKRNLIIERGQLDIRFKDAALLLSNNDTASILSGIYAMHQVALEASEKKLTEQGYTKVVHDILCSYIKDCSKILLVTNDVVQQAINSQPAIVVQTIVDILFKSKIYYDYEADLSRCVFIGIDFLDVRLNKVKFYNSYFFRITMDSAYIKESSFYNSTIDNAFIRNCNFVSVVFDNVYMINSKAGATKITNCDFNGAKLCESTFRGCTCENFALLSTRIVNSDFLYSSFVNCSFEGANLQSVSFEYASLRNSTFHQASVEDIDFTNATFINNTVCFSETLLEDYLYDEILLFSRVIPKTCGERIVKS